MKGLLQRLAARATGTSVAVRSDARLPFGPMGSFQGAVEAGGMPSLTLDVSAPTLGALTSTQPAAVAGITPGSRPEGPLAAPVPRPFSTQPLAPLDSAFKSAADPAAADAFVFQAPAAPPPLVTYADVPEPRSAALTSPASEPAPRAFDQRVPERPPHDSSVRIIREPPILVPLRALEQARTQGAIAPIGSQVAQGMPPLAIRPDEDREVHIHIGCIEVRAVQESAAPRRRPAAPTQQPMSLDTYLAKRGRG